MVDYIVISSDSHIFEPVDRWTRAAFFNGLVSTLNLDRLAGRIEM